MVELPHRLFWQPDRHVDLDYPALLAWTYETVLRETVSVEELCTWLDGPTLVRLWPDLYLPRWSAGPGRTSTLTSVTTLLPRAQVGHVIQSYDWIIDMQEPAPSGDDAHLANMLGALAVGLSDVAASAVMAATGLDETAAAALLTVFTRPGQSVSDLAAGVGTTHSGAVRTADRLQQLGLLERRRREGRRTARLELTAQGTALAVSALAARRIALAELLAQVDQQRLPALREAVEAILRGLPGTRRDAWHICRLCEHAVCRGADCPVGSAVP